MIPEVHFGDVKEKKIDWRKVKDTSQDDDEELAVSPKDVVDALGFDPKDL